MQSPQVRKRSQQRSACVSSMLMRHCLSCVLLKDPARLSIQANDGAAVQAVQTRVSDEQH